MARVGQKYNYYVNGWEALLQQVMYYVSVGYEHYFMMTLPPKKADRFYKTDAKIIEKYQTNLGKDKKYYNKKNGYANFVYLRYKEVAFILMNTNDFKGFETKSRVEIDDIFYHFEDKNNPLVVPFGDFIQFKIVKEQQSLTVVLTRNTYREFKYTCLEYIDAHKYNDLIAYFNRLNGLPAWGGLNNQKLILKKYLMSKIRLGKDERKRIYSKLRIKLKRTPVEVFADEQPYVIFLK